jgi:adenylate cyclase
MTKSVTAEAAWLEDDNGRRFPLQGNCSLGRSAANGVPLRDDASVSRRHAEIQRRSGGEYWLVDFGSRNGTYLNGFRAPISMVFAP